MVRSSLLGGSRIAVNTAVTYLRSLFAAFLVLFSSRWALLELGVTDYGIYSIVGSILYIVVFLHTVLANSDSRFFAICIGEGDDDGLLRVFNASLSLHLVMPLLTFIIGYLIGEYAINNWLVIPEERIPCTILVFRIVMVASFINMVSVPFISLFTAYQNIAENTIISFVQTVLIFISAFVLRYMNGDKLLLYTTLVSLSQALTRMIQVIVAIRMYPCARIETKYFFEGFYSKKILKYCFWSLLGDLGHLFRTQGIAAITNIYFGPAGNAALGIANQVSMQACNLTNALVGATAPEIYTRVGIGDKRSALLLADRLSKIGVILMLVISVPLIVNIDAILRIWLVNPPEGSSILCVSFMIMFIIEKINSGHLQYLSGINRLATVQILILISYISAVLLPFCGLFSLGLLGIGISCIVSMILTRLSILICMKKYVHYSIYNFIKSNVIRLANSLIIFLIIYLLIYNMIDFSAMNLWEVIMSCLISMLIVGMLVMYVYLDNAEKEYVNGFVKRLIKLCGK